MEPARLHRTTPPHWAGWLLQKAADTQLNSPELGGLRFHGDGESQHPGGVPAGGVHLVPAGQQISISCCSSFKEVKTIFGFYLLKLQSSALTFRDKQ